MISWTPCAIDQFFKLCYKFAAERRWHWWREDRSLRHRTSLWQKL